MTSIARPVIDQDFDRFDLIVDALFGTGLSSPPRDARWIEWMNTQPAPVLAVDLPSGLDCDTGEPLGAVAQRILDEMEKSLYQEDPAFARESSPRSPSGALHTARRGLLMFVAGLLVLFAFFMLLHFSVRVSELERRMTALPVQLDPGPEPASTVTR